MTIRWSLVITGIVATAVGFVLEAPGPVGKLIWPLAEGMPEPEGANMVLLMIMGVIEAAAFGAGVVFLVAGYPLVKARMAGSAGWGVATYLSIAWLLVNWVPHTSLHMAHGNIVTPADFGGLVAIEYGFHLTLIVAGSVLALGTLRYLKSAAAAPAAAARPARA